MVVQQGTMRTEGSPGWQGRAWQPVLSYHLRQEHPGPLGQPLSWHQAPPWGQVQAWQSSQAETQKAQGCDLICQQCSPLKKAWCSPLLLSAPGILFCLVCNLCGTEKPPSHLKTAVQMTTRCCQSHLTPPPGAS